MGISRLVKKVRKIVDPGGITSAVLTGGASKTKGVGRLLGAGAKKQVAQGEPKPGRYQRRKRKHWRERATERGWLKGGKSTSKLQPLGGGGKNVGRRASKGMLQAGLNAKKKKAQDNRQAMAKKLKKFGGLIGGMK